MIFRLLFYFFLLSSSVTWAEETQNPAENNMIYSRSSKLTVDNINKAVEILRDPVAAIKGKTQPLKDPTQINENFQQAIKNSRGAGSAPGADENTQNLPGIRLLGKIYHPRSAREILTRQKTDLPEKQSSIVLQIEDEIVHLHEGDSSSVIKNNQLYTIEVEEITPYAVKLLLKPNQATLVLH